MKKRIHGPDVLRGFASVGVVFFHVLYLSGLPVNATAHSVVGRFDFFVRLFFVISAFSMTYVYHERLNSLPDIRMFYLKRFFRLAPLFYFIIALNTILTLNYSRPLPGLYDFILSITFLFPFSPGKHGSIVGGGWSIGIEWIFYILFPFTLSFIRTYKAALIVSVPLIIIAILGHEYFISFADGSLRNFGLLFFLSHIQYFIVGIAAFYLYSITDNEKHHSKQLNGFFIVTIFIFIVIYFKFWARIPEEIVLSVSSFFLVYLSSYNLPFYLDNVITRYLGKISYSIYLMQFPIIQYFREWGIYSYISSFFNGYDLLIYLASCLVTIITVIIISMITFKYIETPGKRLITLCSNRK